MATGGEVLSMLIPTGGYTIMGDDFSKITYDEGVKPVTKKQFEDGFDKFDAWKLEQDQIKAAQKQAILDRIGLSADELKLILG
jgi:hypothetical protein